MKQLALLNPENVSEQEAETYPIRRAARAIVLDEQGNIALLHVAHVDYYKLPGGGLEEGEDPLVGLQRECKEEIGCEVAVIQEIGTIVEYRKIFHLKQISYCYLAKVKGEKGAPNFTEEEVGNGFKQLWLPFEKAVQAVTESATVDIEGKVYIVPRDSIFLEEAKKYV